MNAKQIMLRVFKGLLTVCCYTYSFIMLACRLKIICGPICVLITGRSGCPHTPLGENVISYLSFRSYPFSNEKESYIQIDKSSMTEDIDQFLVTYDAYAADQNMKIIYWKIKEERIALYNEIIFETCKIE